MNNQAYRLYLDDRRHPPREDGVRWVVARTYHEFIAAVEDLGRPEWVAFDYDLGDESPHNGADAARWLARKCRAEGWSFPPYSVHSTYAHAVEEIVQVLADEGIVT